MATRAAGTAIGIGMLAILGGGVFGATDPLYGELFGPRSQRVQDSFGSGLEGFALPHDNLGQALASGDFDGDGRDDLAIADYESLTAEKEGAVHVLYGIQGAGAGNVLIKDFDPVTGMGDRELGDGFGEVLAAGDFNGDAYADLAIAVPYEDQGFMVDVGAVLVLYGTETGLATSGVPAPQRFRVGVDGVFGIAHPSDQWGSALAAGDFDHDGKDDLAIGCPRCDSYTTGQPADSGAVWILYGSALGLSGNGDAYFDQDSVDAGNGTPMLEICEAGDRFASALAVGDFDGNLADDLAIGVPAEDLSGLSAVGAVQVLYGVDGAGLRLAGNQLWAESNVATGEVPQANDRFGLVLAAGDVTGEGVDDLAIGAPNKDVAGMEDAGAVTLLWGQIGTGLDTPGSERYTEDSVSGVGFPAAFENFGSSLAIGDVADQNATGARDLIIGAPQEEVFDPVTLLSLPQAGAVIVVPGGFGLDPLSARYWVLGSRGSAGQGDLAAGQHYGYALAAADFDGDGQGDLAIGAPFVGGTTSPGVPASRAGAVYVLFGALFADGFESANLATWSAAVP